MLELFTKGDVGLWLVGFEDEEVYRRADCEEDEIDIECLNCLVPSLAEGRIRI
jgi:hypothetical protein